MVYHGYCEVKALPILDLDTPHKEVSNFGWLMYFNIVWQKQIFLWPTQPRFTNRWQTAWIDFKAKVVVQRQKGGSEWSNHIFKQGTYVTAPSSNPT